MDYIKIIHERKIIDSQLYRKYFVTSEGKEVGIPLYISLVKYQESFYVRASPDKKKHPGSFTVNERYCDASTQELAMLRAIAIIKTMIKGKQVTAPYIKVKPKSANSIEKLGLDTKEIPDGISVNLQMGDGCEVVTVSASYFDPKINKFRTKKFYIGTLNTWKERYPKKLQEAITHREESLKLYNELTQVTK